MTALEAAARIDANFDALDAVIARIRAQMVADGLIRSSDARTRCTDEIDAAADTFAEAGMDDFAAMLRGAL